MIGAFNKTLRGLMSFYLRALLFNNDARTYFYSTLREYANSHFPLLRIFNDMQQQGGSPAMREIAKISKRAIRNNQPFAAHYHRSGLFTEHESRLLILAERYDCMDTVASLLLEQDSRPPVMAQILSSGLQWIAMTLAITAMAIYTLPYLQHYASGYEWFFSYVVFVQKWWLQLAGLVAGLIVCHHWCRRRLTGPARAALARLGLFRLHAMLRERQFLKLSGPLLATRLPPGEFLRLMEKTFGGDKPFRQSLQKGRARLKEASLLHIMQDLLSPQSYRHVLSCAPNQTPDEIAQGFAAAERMLSLRLEKLIKTCRSACALLFLSISIAVTIPFAFVSMGMGIQI